MVGGDVSGGVVVVPRDGGCRGRVVVVVVVLQCVHACMRGA